VAYPGKAFHQAYPEKPWTQIVAMPTCSFKNTLGADPDQVWEMWKRMKQWRGPWFVDFEPVCYVRAEAEKMKRLVAQLREQQAEAQRLDAAIARNLQGLEYGG